jgi:uracil phosphoribosyltransferase
MSQLHVINHPMIQHKLTIMRKKETGSKDFRQLLREISLLMGYEVTRDIPLADVEIETPICPMTARKVSGRKMAIVPILRAGLGMVDGLRMLSPTSKVGHVGLYRDEETLMPKTYYFKLPVDVTEGPVIIVDPALATGGSADASIEFIKREGCKDIRFMCIFASEVGVKLLAEKHPDVHIWCARYMPGELDEHGYIPKAAGDAGDRLNGTYSLKKR